MPNPTILRLRLLSLALIVASLAGQLWLPRPTTATPDASALPAIPFTDVNPLGANFFLNREVEPWKRELTVRMAKEAGIGWMKQMFSWEEIEQRPGYYFDDKFKTSTWKKYDEIVDLAEQHGMRIIARVDRPPAWARQDNRLSTAPPDKLEDYANFVKTLVSRYKGRVQYYQIWNEPNIWPEWGDQAINPAEYVEMLKLAYTKAKEADPNVVILSAPLAQTLEKSERNLSELDFLTAMYEAGARDYFDILAANAYGFDEPPDTPANPDVLNFSRLQLLRAIMVQHGDADKPIWFNEFGWNASPEDFPPQKLIWRRVSEAQQATYTADAIRLARSWGWVGVLNTWYFRQVGDIDISRSDYFFRMVDTDFTPRLVYHEVKALGQEFAAALPGVHEESNPAVSAGPGWHGRSLPSASGHRVLQSPDNGGQIQFRFDGTGLSLSLVSSSTAAKVNLTVDGANSNGNSVIQLPSGSNTGFVVSPVVSGLAPGQHTVTLTLVEGGPWAFDTFEVEHKPPQMFLWALWGVAALGALMFLLTFLRRWQPR